MHEKYTKARLDFCKEQYLQETERSARALERLSVVMTTYSIVAAIIVYYVSNLPYKAAYPDLLFFYIPAGLGVITGLLGIGALRSMIFGGTAFRRFQDPLKFDASLASASKNYGDTSVYDDALTAELDSILLAQYCEITAHNRAANDRRSKAHDNALKGAVVAIIFLVTASPAYFYFRHIEEATPLPVQITQPIKIMSDKPEPKNEETPKPAAPAPGKVVVKIEAPKPEVYKESFGANLTDERTGLDKNIPRQL